MTALTQRDLRLPGKPSLVGPGRDDRDLLWEDMSGRGDPALMAEDAEYHHRPVPPQGAVWGQVLVREQAQAQEFRHRRPAGSWMKWAAAAA